MQSSFVAANTAAEKIKEHAMGNSQAKVFFIPLNCVPIMKRHPFWIGYRLEESLFFCKTSLLQGRSPIDCAPSYMTDMIFVNCVSKTGWVKSPSIFSLPETR